MNDVHSLTALLIEWSFAIMMVTISIGLLVGVTLWTRMVYILVRKELSKWHRNGVIPEKKSRKS